MIHGISNIDDDLIAYRISLLLSDTCACTHIHTHTHAISSITTPLPPGACGVVGCQKGVVGCQKGVVGCQKGLVGCQKGVVGCKQRYVGSYQWKRLVGSY